ncbi:disulfide (thiol) oxidoreductase [Salmon gill poxvirus]|uniref:thiol oxidase n=1 Tax=Salmon gill poxvirus TaxID=1680908 RepID=A0A0H4XWL0_9POXV|nr:disulfide (thiol) oxidoreductase [Salmon gill poxvirus]AKR04201.1 disulfide (thiol) oxidoreductase [Salmon gill poxvirus]WMX26483.1 disulfide (thiol) oxidoreductase [Salmon gill poxvirus]
MNTSVWGHGYWLVIFSVIFIFKSNLAVLKKLTWLIVSGLPCEECREHAKLNITKNNIMSSEDWNVILLFYASLYNTFKTDRPDQTIDIEKLKIELNINN